MKLDTRRVESLLRDLGGIRAVLLHGEDAGLIRELGARITGAVAGAPDDPFRVVELQRDGWSGIGDELAAQPMTGGRRVVRVRDVGEGVLAPVQAALAGKGAGLLLLEAPGLPARSKVRAWLEKASACATVACYPLEAAALAGAIRDLLKSHGVTADDDARQWLESRLGADAAVTRSEIAKLALYVGAGGHVDLAAAQACVGDLAGLSLDDALFAATSGAEAAADRSLELALLEGATPVGVVRAALLHVQRLHRASLAVAAGATVADAVRGARPPVFFRREADFQRAVATWPEAALARLSARLWEADRGCKRTGAPAEAICRGTILGMARRGAVLSRR